jgi:cytochrome b561
MKYLLLTALFIPTVAFATPYEVNKDKSQVMFSGTHAGNDFKGEFQTWDANINFDADNLAESSVTVTFNTASANTGNAMYDGTLPKGDWFDADNHPTAMFQSTSFNKTDDGYSVTGDLSIKDITNEVTFDFDLHGDDPIHMMAQFPIDRLAFDVGKGSDPDAEWVSQDIMMDIHLEAMPK